MLKHYSHYDPSRMVQDAARGNIKHNMALWACLHYRPIPSPICKTTSDTFVVWMGRNTAYRMLREHGFTWDSKYGVWRASRALSRGR